MIDLAVKMKADKGDIAARDTAQEPQLTEETVEVTQLVPHRKFHD